MLWRKTKPDPFWSTRKLLICYSIFKDPKKQQYHIADFLFPFHYPRSTRTSNCEGFRIAKCLCNLSNVGIRVEKAEPHLEHFPFEEARSEDEDEGDQKVLFQKFYTWFIKSIFHRKPARFSSTWIQEQILARQYKEIRKDGSGEFTIPDNVSFEQLKDLTLPMILPYFCTFTLSIDRKRLKKAITEYMKCYRAGVLHLAERNFFDHKKTRDILHKFFERLEDRQSTLSTKDFRPKQWDPRRGQAHDDLLVAFSESYPKDFDSWKMGVYDLPVIEHFISEDLAKNIRLTEIKVRKPKLTRWTSDSADDQDQKMSHYRDMVRAFCKPFSTYPIIFFEITPAEKAQTEVSRQSEIITLIEVTESHTDEYIVYLNGDALRPVYLNKKNKSGKLLYVLASESYAEYRTFAQGFRYMQTDKRFTLFSKTNYHRTKLLDLDEDGYIIPVASLTIRLIEQAG